MNDIRNLISIKLKGLRAENSFSLDYVGRQLELHRETVRRYENNPSLMSVDTFLKLLDLYHISSNVFFEEIYAKMP